jgi:hypothetical protein
MIVDSIYEELGTDFWPEPHNFKKFAGMEYFLNRIEENNPELQNFNHAGQFWNKLGSGIGFSNIQSFFYALKEKKVDNPGAMDKFTKVLEGYMEEQDIQVWFVPYADDLIISIE